MVHWSGQGQHWDWFSIASSHKKLDDIYKFITFLEFGKIQNSSRTNNKQSGVNFGWGQYQTFWKIYYDRFYLAICLGTFFDRIKYCVSKNFTGCCQDAGDDVGHPLCLETHLTS